jgi:hypothetical protein
MKKIENENLQKEKLLKMSANQIRQLEQSASQRLRKSTAAILEDLQRKEFESDKDLKYPTDLNIRLCFTGASDVIHKKDPWAQPLKGQRTDRIGISNLSEKDIEQLKKIEPKLMKWIKTNDENAVLFFADPFKALSKAGIELDSALLNQIKRIRSQSAQLSLPIPQVTIKSLKITAKHKGSPIQKKDKNRTATDL